MAYADAIAIAVPAELLATPHGLTPLGERFLSATSKYTSGDKTFPVGGANVGDWKMMFFRLPEDALKHLMAKFNLQAGAIVAAFGDGFVEFRAEHATELFVKNGAGPVGAIYVLMP